MTVILYHFTGEKMMVDKTPYLSEGEYIQGQFREGTNVTSPVILVERVYVDSGFDRYQDNEGRVAVTDDGVAVGTTYRGFFTYNYCYIQELNRYYFISDISVIRHNLYSIFLREDVLMSYKDNILNLTPLVGRNQYTYNSDIGDEYVNYEYSREVTEEEISQLSGDYTRFEYDSGPWFTGLYNIAVTTLADLPNESSVHDEIERNPLTPSFDGVLQSFHVNNYTSSAKLQLTYLMDSTNFHSLCAHMIENDSDVGYIASVVILPYNPSAGPSWQVALHSGWLKDAAGNPIMGKQCTYKSVDVIKSASWSVERRYGDFRDFSPYTEYEVFIPYFGWKTLTPDQFIGGVLSLYYIVDLLTGSATVYLIEEVSRKMIFNTQCQLGVRVNLDTTNSREVNDTRLATGLNMAINSVGSVVAMGAGLATANPLAVVAADVNFTRTIANGVTTLMTTYERANSTVTGGTDSLFLPQTPKMRITRMKAIEYGDDYNAVKGRPLKEFRKLSTLKGFTVVDQVHLTDFGDATVTEINEVENILKSGFIL